jgi:hypothetical protein
MCRCYIYQVLKTLLLIFCLALPPPPEYAETVAASAAADPVDIKAMEAEQNRGTETQRLLGVSSLQLAFRQAGTQRLNRHFSPHCPTGIQKRYFFLFSQSREARLPTYGVF